MDTDKIIIARITRRQGLDLSTFRRVETASSGVYTDGNYYIKQCPNTTELRVLQWLYPDAVVDSTSVQNKYIVLLRNLGETINEKELSSEQFIAWVTALRCLSAIMPPFELTKLDIRKEIGMLQRERSKLDTTARAYLDKLVEGEVPNITATKQIFLHGDPNFRNVVFDGHGEAHVIDFDHATIGPIEWDAANVLMVCMIAGRYDLQRLCNEAFHDADINLIEYFLRLRFAQSLVHTVLHLGFETKAGLQRRIRVVDDFLAHSR